MTWQSTDLPYRLLVSVEQGHNVHELGSTISPKGTWFAALLPGSVLQPLRYGRAQACHIDCEYRLHHVTQGLLALQSFMASGRAQADFQPMPLPQLRLSVEDQCRLRDRSTIMARQMYATQGSDYADAQVCTFI